MNKHQTIERLLKATTAGQWNMSAAFGGAAGTSGMPRVLQTDVNKAIELWLSKDDSKGVRQIADTLHLTGGLTEAEYTEIMKAIDGEA